MVESGRSKFFFYNSMVCLAKAMEGKNIRVEIRNDAAITGRLDLSDSAMNLTMSDVVLTNSRGLSVRLAKFYIRGRHIRYLIIPDETDMIKAMEWQLHKREFFMQKERKNKQKFFEKRRRAQKHRK